MNISRKVITLLLVCAVFTITKVSVANTNTKVIKQITKNTISKKYQYVGKKQIGLASWYGGFFNGRTAADGSTYNMDEFTAAHKKLPFGCIVKVTNLNNNKTCVVRITDRGPFIGKRIIDLSRAAAKKIDMYDKGISKVKLEIIGRKLK